MLSDGQREIAARKFCELTGTDPEERIPDPSNTTMAYVVVPRWKAMASEVAMYAAIIESIEFAKKEKQQ